MNFARRIAFVSLFGALCCSGLAQTGYQVKPNHPRVLITDVPEVARRCEGPLADDYRVVKDRADAAVRRGHLEFISNKWSIPEPASVLTFDTGFMARRCRQDFGGVGGQERCDGHAEAGAKQKPGSKPPWKPSPFALRKWGGRMRALPPGTPHSCGSLRNSSQSDRPMLSLCSGP